MAEDPGTGRQYPCLTAGLPAGPYFMLPQYRETRIYQPLHDEPALFRTFADTPPNIDGIGAFANKYGPLVGFNGTMTLQRPNGPVQIGTEEASIWFENILEMRCLLDVVTMVNERPQDLERHFHWTSADRVVWVEDPTDAPEREKVITSPDHRPDLLAYVRPPDLRWPAYAFLQDSVNGKLVGTRRELDGEFLAFGGVTPALLWDPSPNQHRRRSLGCLSLHLRPRDLLGALWLQLAVAIAGNKQYRSCPVCGRWFELLSDSSRRPQRGKATAGRASRFYCSTSCRVTAYRRRKQEARSRHAAGESIDVIACALDSDPETVRTWIELPRRGRRIKE